MRRLSLLLKRQYIESKTTQTGTIASFRITRVLRYWIENYWTDVSEDQDATDRLNSFVEGLKDDSIKTVLKSLISRKVINDFCIS